MKNPMPASKSGDLPDELRVLIAGLRRARGCLYAEEGRDRGGRKDGEEAGIKGEGAEMRVRR